MQGRLGHQVLGQLLIVDSTELAVAGAAVAIAAATGPRNQVAQVALRTVVPAVAAHLVVSKQEERVDKKKKALDERQHELADVQRANKRLENDVRRLAARLAELEKP